MFSKRMVKIAMSAVVAWSLLFIGCAQNSDQPQASAQTDSSAKSGAGEKKSGGVLGRIFASTKPVSLPEGTAISVALDHSLASDQQKSGDSFEATVTEAVTSNGATIIPAGARVRGRVVEAQESGRLKGVAILRLALEAVEVEGKSYAIETNSISRSGGDHKKRNWVLIGGGTGAGAAIGAAAGGGKGAVIGGAIGAGAGTATAAATGKKEIILPAETRLSFRLMQPVTVQVKG